VLVSLILAAALSGLSSELSRLARGVDGILGASVVLVETGEHAAVNGDGHFPMQSVYKAPIGMAVLHAVDEGRLALDQPVRVEASDLVPAGMHSPLRDAHPKGGVDVPLRELLRLAVEESDGTASDVLLRVAGGRDRAQAFLGTLGIDKIRIATTEGEMGRDFSRQYQSWATPDEAARWLVLLQQGRGLRRESRDLLLGWMRSTRTFPTRLKGLLPAGTEVAHKTGSSGSRHGVAAATNDIGIVTLPDGRHLAVAVFLRDSRATDAERDAAIARVAQAAFAAATASDGGAAR
jgi:beta-lactamase class A